MRAGFVLCGMCLCTPWAFADDGPDVAAACVEVEVNGERAPSFSCLTQKLTPPAQKSAGTTERAMASEEIARRPSQQLGLFNRAATEHRMGNTFGTSVKPQRPPAYVPASPIIPAPHIRP